MGLDEYARWLLAEVVLIARLRYGLSRARYALNASQPTGRH